MPNETATLTAEQDQWLDKVSGSLTAQDPRANYLKTRTALAGRFKQAILLEGGKKVADDFAQAEGHFQKQEYADALECLEGAGEAATELISRSEKYVQSQAKGGATVSRKPDPLKSDQNGAAKTPKSKELSPEVRQKDIAGKVYYADTPEKRAQSEFKVGADGRLIDAQGNALNTSHGFAVNADDGTRHHFNSAEGATKDGGRLHHSSEVNGGAVTAAGEQTVEDGLLRKVTDKSGHYQPDGEMTHNYFKSLKQDGVKTLDEAIVAIGADGKMRQATPEEKDSYRRVQEELPALEAEAKKRKDAGGSASAVDGARLKEIDQEIAGLKTVRDQLRKAGVGARNKDAIVEVFKPSTRFSPEDWEKVEGKKDKIQQAIIDKLGMKLKKGQKFPDRFDDLGVALDVNDMNKTNALIGTLMRASEIEGQELFADKSQTHLGLDAEQFLQTGGNVKAAAGKQDVSAEVLTRKLDQLGGAKELNKMGIDASKFTPQQQIAILETPRLFEKLKGVGVEDPKSLPPARIVEAVEVPDSLFEKLAELGSAAKLKEMGIDPSKIGLRQQLAVLERGISRADLKNLEELGINDPAALPTEQMNELLETADTLKDFPMIKPKEWGWPVDGMLKVIRLIRTFPDRKEVKDLIAAELEEEDGPEDVLNTLQKAIDAEEERQREEEERQRQEEERQRIEESIVNLGGAAKVGELVGDASGMDGEKQLALLERAADFAGLEGPKTLKVFGVNPAVLTVDQLLEFLKTAKEINALGGAEKLANNQIKEKVNDKNAAQMLRILQDIRAREERLKKGAFTLIGLGLLNPEKLSVEKQLELLDHAQSLIEFGGREKLAELKIDLATTSGEKAVAMLKAESLGGAEALAEIGFPDPSIFSPAKQVEVLKLKSSFAGLGGIKRLDELGVGGEGVADLLGILQVAARLKSEFQVEASDYPAHQLRVVLTMVQNGQPPDNLKKSNGGGYSIPTNDDDDYDDSDDD